MVQVPTRAELRAHLVTSRIAGEVETPRDNNLRNYRLLAERHPHYLLGLDPAPSWTFEEVLAVMAKRCGVSPDPDYIEGIDTIDPDRTLERLDALGARLAVAARRRERVISATGHPSSLLALHLPVAQALAARGCTLLTPAAGFTYETTVRRAPAYRQIRYVSGVAMVADRGELKHTHSPRPMQEMLAALDEPPDLVVADHGFTGAAAQAGVDAVGYADSNDPALFVGEAEGTVAVTVPLDDGVLPHLYAPVTAYLLARIQ